jgi:MFS family permease
MIVTQFLQFAISAALATLTLAHLVAPAVLFAASSLFALCGALEMPARQAFIPNLVPREELTSAIALNTTQRNVGNVAGPSLAGLVLANAGPAWCYGVDATSWIVMLGALLLIRSRQPIRARSGVTVEALREGFTFVGAQPVVMALILLDFGATFFGNPNALLPVYARDLLHVGAEGLGILYAARSFGAIAAAAVVGSMGQPKRAGLGVICGVVFYALCAMGFALSPYFWLSVILLAGMGAGDLLSETLRATIVQFMTPDALRGRVTAVNTVFTSGGPQLGQLESGVVAGAFGAGVSAFTGGLATLLLVTAIALVPAVRRFRLTAATAEPARS